MTVRVIITERDCDNMQCTYSRQAKNMRAMNLELEKIQGNAEGPVWWSVVTKADYEEFEEEKRRDAQQFRRDLAAEQAGY